MKQVASNLTDEEGGFLQRKRYVLMDRDTKFCQSFRNTLSDAGVEPVFLPPQSPNLNVHLDRFIRSLRDECVHRMIFFGERSLRNAVHEFVDHHYRHERNHQGLVNTIIAPGVEIGRKGGEIKCRERLGGLLRYYHREAACRGDCRRRANTRPR